MEQPPVIVEDVKNLQPNGKRLLEGLLRQQLQDNQQIFIMVLSPGSEPDEDTRRRARAGLESTFRNSEAYAQQHGIADKEIDAAIREAMDKVRPRTE